MKTALEAPNSGAKYSALSSHTFDNKVEGSGTYGSNRGILHPLTVFITVKTASEALLLHKLGYLSAEELVAVGVPIPKAPKYGSKEYNEAQKAAITTAIWEYFGYTRAQLEGKSRKGNLPFARHLSIYLLCTYTTYTLKTIGAMYGGRDHTTALYGRDKIINYLSSKGHSERKETITRFLSTHCFEND